jgi:hypothetical protein
MMKIKQLFAACMMLFAAAAHATTFSCSGTVTQVGLGQYGDVLVEYGGYTAHLICNVTTQGSYAPDTNTCRAIYGQLVLAKATGASITACYNNSTYTSCSAFPVWNTMTGLYMFVG